MYRARDVIHDKSEYANRLVLGIGRGYDIIQW